MTQEHNAGWTNERVAELIRLWDEGQSASQIAVKLRGGVTRVAVCAKVWRLKLPKRSSETARLVHRSTVLRREPRPPKAPPSGPRSG